MTATGPTDQEQLATALAQALRDRLGTVTVEDLTRLSGGASRETWAFDAVAADGSRTELVLRRDPPGRPSEPGAMGREARAIAAAQAAGLAVPEVLISSNEAEPVRLGRACDAARSRRDDRPSHPAR